MADGWSDKGIERFLAALFAPLPGETVKGTNVSLQMRDCANPDARKELRERISDLLGSHMAALSADPAPDGMQSDTVKTFQENVKALYHALTGYGPTEDELSEMGGK